MDQFNSHPLYRRHNIDSVMSSLWEFYKMKFLSLFLISLGMSLVIQYASGIIDFKELQSITDPMVLLEKMKDYIVPVLIISIINLIFTAILQYYILYNPLSPENNILVSAFRSMRYFIPYLIIMILLAFAGSIAIVLGLLVLIVGVIFSLLYIMMLYLFILPVLMVEGTNIVATIRRTFTLAHRNFWTNLGWVAVFVIILVVISVILSGLVLLPFTGNFVKTIMNPGESTGLADTTSGPLFIIISAVVGALTMPLMPIFACILYFNGRAAEDESQTGNITDSDNDRVRVEDLYAKPYSDDHPDNPDKNV